MTITNKNALRFFLNLARRGKNPASSSSELASCRLAKEILADIDILDGLARDGLHEFIEFAAQRPQYTAELIGK